MIGNLKMLTLLAVIVLLLHSGTIQLQINANQSEIDSNGYIFYCPCMGRFGNQAEQFLGALHFAKHLNRTLILPPFIEYDNFKVNFIPFTDYINVKYLPHYHRVIVMDEFMSNLSPTVWKESERSIACYSARSFGANLSTNESNKESCNPFEGSPFKEFWRHVGIEEFPAGSLYYQPFHTDYHFSTDWIRKYGDVQVLTFVGAPSSFPTNSEAVKLQKFVKFSDKIAWKAKEYRSKRKFFDKPYLSIHLRHGSDWARACDLINDNPDMRQLFSSQQCLGDSGQRVHYDLCMPRFEQIVNDIRKALKDYNEIRPNDQIRHVHISTDSNNESLWYDLRKSLEPESITLITPGKIISASGDNIENLERAHFMVDLYLMSHSNMFIGNCISSFSAFVSRYRIYHLNVLDSSRTRFFNFEQHPSPKSNNVNLRDEL